jgi:hypothetical protein
MAARNGDVALSCIAGVEGWLTEAQATRLWECAAALAPSARVVEIGSYRGRSAIVLAMAAPTAAEVIAIDPHAGNDRGPRQIEGSADEGQRDNAAFHANLARAGVGDRVRHLRLPSQDALAELPGEVDLLYVDGAHRFRPARGDLVRWGARVRPGGRMLVHDAFSSVGVTLAVFSVLGFGAEFRYEGRTGSLAEYTRARVAGAARVRNALRQLSELPWFARNVVVKVLIVLRLRSGDWPY